MMALLLAALLSGNTNPAPISTGLVFEVTAYSLGCAGCSELAANGRPPVVGVSVACPRRFPFGTRLHIEGLGERVCHDRGSSIRQMRLDIFMASRAEAIRWGRRTLRVRRISPQDAPGDPNEPRKGIGAPSGVAGPQKEAGDG